MRRKRWKGKKSKSESLLFECQEARSDSVFGPNGVRSSALKCSSGASKKIVFAFRERPSEEELKS